MMNGGFGVLVETEKELEFAIDTALNSKELFVINVSVDPQDISPVLRRIVENLSKRV